MPSVLPDDVLLARLVAFDTTSDRSNLDLVAFIADYLDRPGLDVSTHHSAAGDKATLVVRTGPAPTDERDGLVLNGHLDTVPADEPEWTGNPFTLRTIDDRLVARGACDMKGFDAIAVNVMAATDPDRLASPLALILTYDEEVGSLGAQAFIATADVESFPRAVLIGEPTSLRAVRMHKGHLKMRITTHGRSAHSGSPHLGHNAVHDMIPVLAALDELRRAFEGERVETSAFFPDVPNPLLGVMRIRGGTALNVIPDRCVVEVGIRLLPGQASDATIARVRCAVEDAGAPAEVEIINDNPPMLLDEASSVHRTLCGVLDQSTTRGVSFSSDAGWLARAGFECVLCGPGSITVAHRPDEFVPRDEMSRARTIVERLVEQCCGHAERT
ncbi:MAG: acetylornithine deacetylase [Phycisphaerales bacterium]|nr:acetylornithine deacetylase [Phycisphaerales bacterium]